MKRIAICTILVLMLAVAALPAAGQNGPRVQPIVISASENNNAANAFGFQANSQIIVNNVNTATNETGEPSHTCAGGIGTRSVWFTTRLMPGTVTLSTAGSSYTTSSGPSADTVISLYRMTSYLYTGFGDLDLVACHNNSTGAGIISSAVIPSSGIYYIQVSAAPGVMVTGVPSQVVLTATVTNDQPMSYDEPSGAKKLKFVGMPAILNLYNATRSLDEPLDPYLSDPITNTVWFKFKITGPRVVGFQNFYAAAGDSWFSLFQKSGPDYIPAAGFIDPMNNILTAHLEAGTYFLRVGSLSDARGTNSYFTTIVVPAYILPHGYSFAVPGTEGTANAEPSLEGWNVKNGDPGVNGDIVVCDTGTFEYCKFQLASSGPTEKTVLKANMSFNATKVKKGDVLQVNVSLDNMVGTPKFDVILKLTSPNGTSQKYVLKVQSDDETHSKTVVIPKAMAISKAVLTIKNKDVVPGNKVEIDGVIAAAIRVGEGLARDLPLLMPGGPAPAWQPAAPDGVLPAPPPPAH